MSLILQIETATTLCSVALARDKEVMAFKEVNQRNIHAEVITVFIDELMKECSVNYANLDAIAVSCGPGSYTGLRIGVSTAKGLCFALNKPLIAIDTLAAMASGVISNYPVKGNTLLCPMIDARRMEVYTAVYDSDLQLKKPVAAEIINGDSFAGLLIGQDILFFGDGADKCLEVLGGNPHARFLQNFTNSAVHSTLIASDRFEKKEFVDVAYFEPYYLKDFIAGKKAGAH